jgi:hypothetical protein
MNPFEGRSITRLLLPYVAVLWAVAAFVWSANATNGVWWIGIAGLVGFTVPWRVRMDEEGVTLWFPFGRRSRYSRREAGLVANWRSRSLALKGRGWWNHYGVPASSVPGPGRIDAAAESFGYTVLRKGEIAAFTRRRPKSTQSEPRS